MAPAIVAIANTTPDGKGAIVVAVTADLTQKYDARPLVIIGNEALGGKGGGGRPDMAQGGGPNGANAQEALDRIKAAIAG